MTASYLYCVVKAPRKPSVTRAPEGLPGAGKPDAINVAPGLWLIVADVPLEAYGGEALERSLGDLDWVGRIALAHEAVVEHFATRRDLTVIPMKLFTMFSSTSRAAADVARRRATIERTMRRIGGAEEWGIRIFRREAARAPKGAGAPPASGAAFLAAKKQARDDVRSARAAAAEAALQAYEALAELAREARRRDDAGAAGATPPLLDAAFLVPLGKRGAFTRAAKREADACERAGAELALSGPWPAYNFIDTGEAVR